MVLVSSLSPFGTALPVVTSDAIIVGTFAAAVLVFLLFRGIRRRGPETSPPAENRRLEPAGESPYAPPAELPPPLPIEAEGAPGRWQKVTIGPYRRVDLILIALISLIYFGLTLGSQDAAPIPLEEKYRPDVLVASIVFQLLLMGMVIAFVRWRVSLTEWLGLRWKSWPLALAIAPLTVFFMWCLMGLLFVSGWNAWLERNFEIESMQEAVRLFQEAKDPVVLLLMVVAAVIVAPLTEEVIFRGYLYPAAKRFCGPIGGILFSSLIFSAAHGTVIALVPLFILAVVLCLIYEVTGSIWSCIAVHFLFNAATVTIQLLARSGLVDLPAPP